MQITAKFDVILSLFLGGKINKILDNLTYSDASFLLQFFFFISLSSIFDFIRDWQLY